MSSGETATPTMSQTPPARRRAALSLRLLAERWSLLLAFVAAFVFFSAAKPHVFLTWANFQAILDDASVLTILAAGATMVLVIGEFDLSIGSVVNLAAVAGVSVMSFHHWSTGAAIAVSVGAGALAGLINGIVVAFLRVPSFIGTLAVGSLAGGVNLAIASSSVFSGLKHDYLQIALLRYGGISLRTFIAGAVVLLVLILLRTTVFGRHASAVGDNPAAARFTGVPVQRVRVIVFVLTGMTAGLAAVLATSSAQSYYSDVGTGFLLPAYAAAFLGLALGGGLRFNVLGTYVGVLLLGMVTTGLTIMNEPNWIAALVEGFVLLVAVAGVAIRRRGTLER
ncbi:MAG: ABC transporter permease [Actinomycetota bacterium]|nr:ABC transporter permease [Actinomycetota bacterium]